MFHNSSLSSSSAVLNCLLIFLYMIMIYRNNRRMSMISWTESLDIMLYKNKRRIMSMIYWTEITLNLILSCSRCCIVYPRLHWSAASWQREWHQQQLIDSTYSDPRPLSLSEYFGNDKLFCIFFLFFLFLS